MSVLHTFNALLPGYESLEISINVRLTQVHLDLMRQQGKPATAIVDFPNWDEVAQVCQLVTVDPDTGEATETALPKPPCPLIWESLSTLPFDLLNYLTGNQCLNDGLQDYMETVHPNLRRR